MNELKQIRLVYSQRWGPDWMLTFSHKDTSNETLADAVLRDALLIIRPENYFRRENLPQAVAVLRFHGFEVEVEE